jgi:hypothetical protein
MKTLRPDEILVYAKSQIAHAEQHRVATPVIIGCLSFGTESVKVDPDFDFAEEKPQQGGLCGRVAAAS